MLGRASQEVRPGGTSGEVMPTSSGSDAAAQEATQVHRQRFSVLREEHILLERRKAGQEQPRSQGWQRSCQDARRLSMMWYWKIYLRKWGSFQWEA